METSSKNFKSLIPENSGLKGVGILFSAESSQFQFLKKLCFLISSASSFEEPNRTFG